MTIRLRCHWVWRNVASTRYCVPNTLLIRRKMSKRKHKKIGSERIEKVEIVTDRARISKSE